ncbi:glycosyltransferase [Pelomonas sp. P7]|uniref:Glycosyltransferase n=1 Tax=Pelomonas caseinilytica TaxID=2906763 RepID=A0ABS8XCJ8_9BURK|nr:glycosyltransferase [Pelomonas sp. P7]MCE4536293.1 glycosyltransferase [Pelomonas sp. P7]
MPFALNESTRFISPTKTLEYMAGGKPVVSTPVKDVVALYGSAVAIAADAPAFVEACKTLLAEGGEARARRAQAMRDCVARFSWDRSADTVHQHLQQALRQAQPERAAPVPADEAPMPVAAAGGLRS